MPLTDLVTFREPQLEAHEAIKQAWKAGIKNIIVSLPTGTGKSIMALEVVSSAIARGQRVLWLAHRERLLTQAETTFRALWPEHLTTSIGTIQGRRNDVDKLFTLAMIDTMRNPNRLTEYLRNGVPNLVIVDEAHHALSNSYMACLSSIDNVSISQRGRPVYKLGLTATVERGDGQELGDHWTGVYFYPLHLAIENGYLVKPKTILERLPNLDLDSVEKEGKDFNQDSLAKELLLKGIVDHTVTILEKHGKGRKPMVYCANVQQATDSVYALVKAGWKASLITGETPENEREEIIKAFENARPEEKHAICNVMVLTEGTDIPCIDLVLMARPTKSKSLYIQASGRGLRSAPMKADCLLIDIAGVSEEHDLITAPVLLKTLKREQTAQYNASKGNVNTADLSGMAKRRTRTRVDWIELDRLDRKVFCVDCGKENGNVFLVQDQRLTTLWTPVWVRKEVGEDGRNHLCKTPLSRLPVDLSMAIGIGEDIARRASRLTVEEAKKTWAEEPATDAQVNTLHRLYKGEVPMGLSRGEAARMLTQKLGRWVAVEAGLARKVGA